MSDYRFKIGDFAPTEARLPKISCRRCRPNNYSFSQIPRLNVLLYGIKILTDFSSVLSQFTRLTDGQTDGQTEFSSLDCVCIPSSAVEKLFM